MHPHVLSLVLVTIFVSMPGRTALAGDWIRNYPYIADTNAGWQQLKDEAMALAVSDSNLGYPSTHQGDHQTFTIPFTTGSTGAKMAVLSDDGVNVTVHDRSTGQDYPNVLNQLGQGQALPNVDQSLKRIPFDFLPDHDYDIELEYSNPWYYGAGDIDGAVFLAFAGEANEKPTVNLSKPKYPVVTAKDDSKGMPGGMLSLGVTVTPDGTTATLDIVSPGGGTAAFQDQLRDLTTVTAQGTTMFTILGRNVSTAPRDVAVKASVAGQVLATFDFTVFRVDTTAITSGKIVDALPPSAMNHIGDPLWAGLLNASDSRDLGNHIGSDKVQGGIVMKGVIVPSGISRNDFDRTHDRALSFNWDRKLWVRRYNNNGCIIRFLPYMAANEATSDDGDDSDEDLTPDDDQSNGQLQIWVIDIPTVPARDFIDHDGDIARIRSNFCEQPTYGGVNAGAKTNWFWHASITNPDGSSKIALETQFDASGDNIVGVGSVPPLTYNLQPSTTPIPTLTDRAPESTTRPAESAQITLTIQGTDLKSACTPYVMLYRENRTGTTVERTYYTMATVSASSDTLIRGNLLISGTSPIGDYDIYVCIQDQMVKHPMKFRINAP